MRFDSSTRYHHSCEDRYPAASGAVAVFFIVHLLASGSSAQCPPDSPPNCAIEDQFAAGRWDLSQLSGHYDFSGTERYHDLLSGVYDDYSTSGTLNIEMIGGAASNYIDVACDGTVTGQATERISGTIDKDFTGTKCAFSSGTPGDMSWMVTIDRTYSITGTVTGPGTLDLDLQVHTATLDISGSFAQMGDCVYWSTSATNTDFDVSGDTELVTLSGPWAPGQATWDPSVSPRGPRTWLDDIAKRLEMDDCDSTCQLTLHPTINQQSQPSHYQYFALTSVNITQSAGATLDPTAPVVTSFVLDEPRAYLEGVPAMTSATATIDWRGETPDQVEFTYGATTETVAGASTVSWDFDAGEPATTIEAVAIQGAQRSLPYVLAVPKVAVPGWAGSAGDWSGGTGVQYEATLDWPVSLQTTQTLDTISLFTGLWGISADAQSTFETRARSDGSPQAGDLETTASFSAAGKSFDFEMAGTNTTTLDCDELTTTGSATATLGEAEWQKTLNPLTAIPGLEAATCALSGLLCSALNAIGVKASAAATLSGTATFTGEGEQISWDGGSLAGTLSGQISATAGLPPPLASLASVSVYGGGTGCLELMVAPDFELTQVAGDLEVGASVSFLGLGAEESHEWQFGGGCSRAPSSPGTRGPTPAFVPADGQLATATALVDGELIGVAVWSHLPAGQARPSGDIQYRIWRDGIWGSIRSLTNDADADTAPAVIFDSEEQPLLVWQRSEGAVPTMTSELPAFADNFELHWASIDLETELPAATGSLTANANNDFGARLIRDSTGNVSLFWQRVQGIDLLGNAAQPATILQASWNTDTGTWSAEQTVASGLEGVWGWSAAAHSVDEMLVGLIADVDQDASTDIDREVLQITRTAGVWMLPVQVTSNSIADDSVQAAFDSDGAPQLLWRRLGQVRELRGDLGVADQLAFTTADPTLDDGIGLEFAHGRVVAASAGLISFWPESTDLLVTRDLPDNLAPGWTLPELAFGSSANDARLVHSLRAVGDELLVGWSSRAFTPGNNSLQALIEPRFLRTPAQPAVFSDGFETGDTVNWSSTIP